MSKKETKKTVKNVEISEPKVIQEINETPEVNETPELNDTLASGFISEYKKHLPIIMLVAHNSKFAEVASKNFVENFNEDIEALVVRYPSEDKSVFDLLLELIADYGTEKIILLDNIISVSPFTMADLEVLKAQPRVSLNDKTIRVLKDSNLPVTDFRTKTPVVLERSKIVQLIEENQSVDFNEVDFLSVYFNRFFSQFKPILTDWQNDSFTLPVVSEKPSHDVLKAQLQRKRWFAVSAKSLDAVLDFFNEIADAKE